LEVNMSSQRKLASSNTTVRRLAVNEPASFTATRAKNEFGLILEKVLQGERVVITKHDTPKAIVISMDEFNMLSRSAEAKLNSLSEEFDAMFARMQSGKSRAAMEAAFSASPEELGKAAVTAARKRG
jgi:prevent-host-death family protein